MKKFSSTRSGVHRETNQIDFLTRFISNQNKKVEYLSHIQTNSSRVREIRRNGAVSIFRNHGYSFVVRPTYVDFLIEATKIGVKSQKFQPKRIFLWLVQS